MKFKRIEISAFRIYDNPADATFDFTIENGEVADFVSLYAPNGFGKTSFYDAVEWGITNNIQRFWQNLSVAEKSIDALKEVSTGQVKLWRHTDSENDTYVQIEDDKSEIIKRELHIDGRSTIDAKKEGIVNKDFRKVVLSQEWISAFLKEINGEQRYKIFMENPELRDLDNYYKGLKSLVSVCHERIDALDRKIEASKAEIVEIGETNLLDTINSTISVLINYGEDLSMVNLGMSQEQVLALKNTISSKLVSNKSNSFLQVIDNITLAKSGSDDLIGTDRYYEFPALREKANIEIRAYGDLMKQFDQLSALINERDNNLKDRSAYQSRIDQIDKVLANFPEFNRIVKVLSTKRDQVLAADNKMKGLREKLEEEKRFEVQQEAEISSAFKQTQDLQTRILKIPAIKWDIENAEERIGLLENQKGELINKSNLHDNTIKEKQSKIEEFQSTLALISKDEVPTISSDLLGQNADVPERLTSNYIKLSEIKVRLDLVNKQIDQNQSLNSTLQDFIKIGLEIVNDTQTSSCPLCTQNYTSYLELTQIISGNTALNEGLQILFTQKSELSAISSNTSNQVTSDKKILSDLYENLIIVEEAAITGINVIIEGLSSKIKELDKQIDLLEAKILAGQEELGGVSPDSLVEQLNILLGDRTFALAELRNKLSELKTSISSKEREIQIEIGKSDLLKSEIINLEKDEKYAIVTGWFLKELPGVNISESPILDEKGGLVIDLAKNLERFSQLELDITALQTTLSSYSKDEIKRSHEVTQQLINRINSGILKFQEFLKNNFEIISIPAVKDDLLKLLDDKANEARKGIDKADKVRIEFEKLERYAQNLSPYLQSENLKAEIVSSELEQKYLTDEVRVLLVDERDKAKAYLENKVKDFFYIKLINSIYNKINPHPNFKSVDFRVNFDSDNPRLDIYVINEASEELLIPNLYFSTAQINILSLSIFLASALNSNIYNCIFIDDPIQSLDSINILSTIDLIRSIVVNQKRQIVLSTHDENFHNLLKKKMPSNLFKSKFLELETFGKIKS